MCKNRRLGCVVFKESRLKLDGVNEGFGCSLPPKSLFKESVAVGPL
jgi:hypothetical protein